MQLKTLENEVKVCKISKTQFKNKSQNISQQQQQDEGRVIYSKKTNQKNVNKRGNSCGRCGYSHEPRNCPAFGETCRKCNGKNHLSRVCNSKVKMVKIEIQCRME